MKLTHKSSAIAQTSKITKVNNEESKQQEESDGYGSITEMVMNKDALVEKSVNKQLEQQRKSDAIKQAKAKMTEALNNSGKKAAAPASNEMVQES